MTVAEVLRERSDAPVVLKSLGYTGGVRLKGRFEARVADAAETYMSLPVDDVLKGFRRRAGLPAPGNDLSGWAAESTESTFGQWLSGLARLSAVLNDGGVAERVGELLDGYASTIAPTNNPGMYMYSWEKLVCGLVDSAVYAENDRALPLLSKIVRTETFDRGRLTPTANNFCGGEPTWSPDATAEWYTLSENLYRGYLASGDGALVEAARTWHYDSFWSRFLERPTSGSNWGIPAWLHAYSHVNTFAGVAAAYSVSCEPHYLDILRNAYDWLAETQNFATGGFGPHEFLMPEDGSLGRSLEWVTDSAEITCGSWAAFKMCTALLAYTGEARYADWAEALIYNGIGATVPVRGDGRTPYYADYRLGVATKLPYWSAWPCCSGTYLQAVAHIADLVYYETADGVAVALYVPSEVACRHHGRRVVVRQETSFPELDKSEIRVDAGGQIDMELRLRVPSWTTGMSLELNGEPLEVLCTPGEWAVVERTWVPTDRLVVLLGATLRAAPVDKFHPNRVAMLFGPVVLAQDTDWFTPFDAPLPWQTLDWDAHLVREGPELLFTPSAPGTHRMPVGPFRPFYDVPERRPYRIYHELGGSRMI